MDFPILKPIRDLAESGAPEQARVLLRGLIREEGRTIAGLVDDATAMSFLAAVASLSSDLGEVKVEAQAKEELHGLLIGLLPADHPGLLDVKGNLAVTRAKLGDLPGALQLFEQVHAARERLLSADDPALLRDKHNLAVLRAQLGDLPGGHELFEQVHAAQERLLPADHPDLLSAKQSLAVSRKELGDLRGAQELLEHVHAARERLLPADHPDLLFTKLNLATTLKKLGDLPGALKLEEYAHAVWERLLPADHPNLLDSKSNLAVTRGQLGDLHGALELKEQVHASRERRLPADHPDLLSAKLNLAVTRKLLGDIPAAHELFEHVHAARKRLLPANHPHLLTVKLNLAVTRYELGDLHGALKLFEYVYAAWEQLLPVDDPGLLTAELNLAATRRKLGDIRGALELEEQVHAAWERLLPADHPDLLRAKMNLAVTRGQLGDLPGALKLDEHVHAAQERLLTADHPELLAAKLNLAAIRYKLGDLPGALALVEHVYAARKRLLPVDHPHLLRVTRNLAVARSELGDLHGALDLEEQVHAAWERLLPDDHPDLLEVRQNVAQTRMQLGDLPGAMEAGQAIVIASALQLRRQMTLSRRQARDLAVLVSHRVAKTRVFSQTPGKMVQAAGTYFECLELGRSVASGDGALAHPGDRQAAPETLLLTTALHEAMEAIDAHVAAPPQTGVASADTGEKTEREAAGSAADEWSRELARLSLLREERERALFAHLKDHGEVILGMTPEAVAAALAPDVRAVGIHKLECWRLEPVTDPAEGSLQKYKRTSDADHYIAYVVDHDGSVVEIDLGSASKINEAVKAWRAALGSPVEGRGGLRSRREAKGDELTSGQQLRRLLIDPLTEGLDPGTTLHICLDDALHAVPMDALPLRTRDAASNDAPKRLGDVYTVRPELSFARLIRAAQDPDDEPTEDLGDSLLIIGDVHYGEVSTDKDPLDTDALDARILAQVVEDRGSTWGKWSTLLGTKREAIAIDAVARRALGIKPATLGPLNVTRESLSTAAAGKRFVHIATHGWFMPETVKSTFDRDDSQSRTRLLGTEDTVTGFAPLSLCGLVMSGANTADTPAELSARLLTAMELSAFDLSSCELAVLSACETNVGVSRAGQGIQSLRTALHQAGARTSVTSLWRVDDAATRDLMVAFYENVLEKGMGKAEALWAAKGMLRARHEPVRNWAGWVLTGDPD